MNGKRAKYLRRLARTVVIKEQGTPEYQALPEEAKAAVYRAITRKAKRGWHKAPEPRRGEMVAETGDLR